jgi:ribosomal protein L11 methylase PrmA
LAAELVGCMTADGILIASGVSNERIRSALAALSGAGLDVVAEPGDEWALITAVRPV